MYPTKRVLPLNIENAAGRHLSFPHPADQHRCPNLRRQSTGTSAGLLFDHPFSLPRPPPRARARARVRTRTRLFLFPQEEEDER